MERAYSLDKSKVENFSCEFFRDLGTDYPAYNKINYSRMKALPILIIALFSTINAIAQPWIEPTASNIYYQGNVGIGTTTPTNVFHVSGNVEDNLVRLHNNSTTFNETSIRFRAQSPANANAHADFGFKATGSEIGYFFFKTPYNSTERIVINTSGNVGIGTTNPAAKLDIKPTLFGDVGLSIGTGGTISGIINTPANMYINADTNNGQSGLGLIGFGFNRTGFTGGTQILTIKESGNVGIGTTNPEAKLTVKGKIVASEIQVKDISAIIPDYVFKPNYNLMSLNQLEAFVKQNQHLPEVPSEKEFKENGMNMAEMNILLLKKIEELTLYAIEQNKVNEEMKQILKDLNKKLENQKTH